MKNPSIHTSILKRRELYNKKEQVFGSDTLGISMKEDTDLFRRHGKYVKIVLYFPLSTTTSALREKF